MNEKRYLRYRMAVLAYYRCEWTEINECDSDYYKIYLTSELNKLIKEFFLQKMNVPNAAKNIEIFLMTTKEQW